MAEQQHPAVGLQTVTQITTTTTAQEETRVTVTLQMPVKTFKLVLSYLNPIEYAEKLKAQTHNIKKTLKMGKDISEAQVEMLNHEMATSLENLIAKFKEEVCHQFEVNPNDPKDIKLFKVRANKHVISVLEDINAWLSTTLEKISAPTQSIDDKVKEYDAIIKELKKKIKLLQTDKMSVEIHSSDENFDVPPAKRGVLMKSDMGGEKSDKMMPLTNSEDNKKTDHNAGDLDPLIS